MTAPAAVRAATVARTRISFSVTADGGTAACLAGVSGGADAPLTVETWTFAGPAVTRRTLPTRFGETTWTQVLCRPDGRVVFTRPGRGQHRLILAEPDGAGLTGRALTTVDAPAVRLVGAPDGQGLAVAVARTAHGTVVWRVLAEEPWLERVAELPGLLSGGHRLDVAGTALGFTHQHDGVVRPVAVDLRTGAVEPIPGTAGGQHLLLAAPLSGTLLVAGVARGELRLGFVDTAAGAPARFPAVLDGVDGAVAPMAADPAGERFALRVDRGAVSGLMVYEPHAERIRRVDTPAGVIHTVSGWGSGGLRFPFTAPAVPGGIATVDPDTGAWHLVTDDDGRQAWTDAAVHEFTGPDGPIEAVVYGDWRTADRVLVSLHGGPEAATQLGFDPLMQDLAAAGIAVVAPNFRGSTGYGQAFQRALHGAWGGPDLADVRHIARQLARPGRTLMLHGTSYGAFLALLAASADPGLWARCVAVAPFVSGPHLYAEGSPAVRALLDRTGGLSTVDDELGPRDLLRLGGRIAARVLIVHGSDDDVIPVGQSRALAAGLLRAGRDVEFVETPTGGHDPLRGGQGQGLTDRMLRFLLADERG